VSWTSDTYLEPSIQYNAFDRRTVTDIQRKLVKWSERNTVSRYFHAKKSKEMIAAWRLGLEDILRVFNVRSVARDSFRR